MGWPVAETERKKCPVEAPSSAMTPGMAIGPLTGMRVGSGAISHNDEIIATKLGWVRK